MKFKVTKKEMKENYSKIIKLGYCSAEALLHFQEPIAYSAGVYGWACDYYTSGSVIISTGYSPIGNINPDYDVVKKFNDQAREVISNYSIPYQDRVDQVNYIFSQFLLESIYKISKLVLTND